MSRLAPGAVRLGLALLVGGLASGLLTLGVGRMLPSEPVAVVRFRWVIECASPPMPGPGTSMNVVRLAAPAPNGANLDLDFLDADGAVLRTQHTRLIAGAQMSFSLPTREMESGLRVVADDQVDVQVTQQLHDADGGPLRTRSVPCRCRF